MPVTNRRMLGFTMIELLVVITIVAIITGVAYPAYQDYLVESRRTQAQADLLKLAQAMERHKLATYSYKGAAGVASAATDTGVPWIVPVAYSPAQGLEADKYYDLTINAADDRVYQVKATPLGAQAGDGALFYASSGLQGWDRNGDGDADDSGEACWSGRSCN